MPTSAAIPMSTSYYDGRGLGGLGRWEVTEFTFEGNLLTLTEKRASFDAYRMSQAVIRSMAGAMTVSLLDNLGRCHDR